MTSSGRMKPHRPWPLWLAIGAVGFEVGELLVAAGFFVVLAVTGGSQVGTSLISLAVMFVVLALGLVAVMQSLYRMRRWARPATVAWQVLLILFGLSVLGEPWALAVASIVPAAVCLFGLFAPATLRAYEAELQAEALRQQDPGDGQGPE
ncbi:hypothetical protein GCM10022261_23480 [Brevibacterium daeguense]|uniref:Uncharacterized protein n=1 Tax=Brevibacterium daeguense TaxID=909936 RepID=A0ABP8ELI2_9MICO|nr:hypothetical protein [Brevibacterium daeguense]